MCRGDREKKFAQVFAAAKLDGAAMSTMNGRAVEVAVRNATQGEGWVDDLQKVVVRAHFCGKLERICAGACGCSASCPYSCDSPSLFPSPLLAFVNEPHEITTPGSQGHVGHVKGQRHDARRVGGGEADSRAAGCGRARG